MKNGKLAVQAGSAWRSPWDQPHLVLSCRCLAASRPVAEA